MQETLLLDTQALPSLKVGFIGVGGAGGSILQNLVYPFGSSLWYFDTDLRALQQYKGDARCHLVGMDLLRGLGAGGDIELAKKVFEAERSFFMNGLKGLDLVFIFVGLGGSSSVGVQVLISVCKELGILSMIMGTLPFSFESERVKAHAQKSLADLRAIGGPVFVLPNQYLLESIFKNETVLKAFEKVNFWVNAWVQALWNLWFKSMERTISWHDFKHFIEAPVGKTLFGAAKGSGPEAGLKAIHELMLCPFLQSPENARSVDRLLIVLTIGPDVLMEALTAVIAALKKEFGGDLMTLWAIDVDPQLSDIVHIHLLGMCQLTSVSSSSPVAEKNNVPLKKKTSVRNFGQGEFDFSKGLDERGFFNKTQSNRIKGEDLDIPTYIRKNIKLLG